MSVAAIPAWRLDRGQRVEIQIDDRPEHRPSGTGRGTHRAVHQRRPVARRSFRRDSIPLCAAGCVVTRAQLCSRSTRLDAPLLLKPAHADLMFELISHRYALPYCLLVRRRFRTHVEVGASSVPNRALSRIDTGRNQDQLDREWQFASDLRSEIVALDQCVDFCKRK